MSNFYEILGVPRNATGEEIRSRHRDLARELHPDVNPSPLARTQFIRVQEAYEILSDPERRRQYDRTYPHIPARREWDAREAARTRKERLDDSDLYPSSWYEPHTTYLDTLLGNLLFFVVVIMLVVFLAALIQRLKGPEDGAKTSSSFPTPSASQVARKASRIFFQKQIAGASSSIPERRQAAALQGSFASSLLKDT